MFIVYPDYLIGDIISYCVAITLSCDRDSGRCPKLKKDRLAELHYIWASS